MAYTSAQLIAAYTAANVGVAPDAATTALLGAFATQTSTGQLSDSAALAYVLNSADIDTNVAVASYQFFTGKTPTQAGLAYLVNSTANATDLNDPYYASFNIENRYMNFAANLGLQGDGAAAFSTNYSSTAIPVFSTFIGVIYEQIIGSAYAQAAGINVSNAITSVVGRQAAFTQTARERGLINSTSTAAQIDLATRAVAVGYLLVEGIKADVGIYAAGANNFTNSLIAGNTVYNTSMLTTYSVLGGGVGSPIAIGGVSPGVVGSTFAFTGGIDALVGTANDDTFNGAHIVTPTSALLTTFGAIDSAAGGTGNDTLNLTVAPGDGTTLFAAQITVPAGAVSAIETINVRAVDPSGAAASNGVLITATNFAGATSFVNDRSVNATGAGAAPALTVMGLATAQAVGINGLGGSTVVGGLAADYTVAATTADTAFSEIINLSGGTGSAAAVGPAINVTTGLGAVLTATINSNGAVANVVGAIQLDNSPSTVRILNIKADAALTTLAITGLGGLISGTNVATTTMALNITGNANVTLGTLNGTLGGAASISTLNITTTAGTLTTGIIGGVNLFNAGATVNVSGGATTTTANSASVTLGVLSANVARLDASGLSVGGVSTSLGANAAANFIGGAGTDVVTITGGTGAAYAGAINGGAGSDIIAYSTAADLAGNMTPLVSNFEILRVSNAGAAQVYDPTLITGITAYQVGVITGNGSLTTVGNMLANANVTIFGANATAANVTTLNLRDSSGLADVMNIRLDNLSTATTGAAGINGGVIAMGGTVSTGQVETLNIVSAGKQSATGAYNSITLAASGAGPAFADANKVNISGSVGVTFNMANHQHAQVIDASTHTFGVSIIQAAVAAPWGSETIIGSSSNDTINIASNAGNTTTIYTGGGGDAVTLALGTQTLFYKAGSDSTLDLAASAVGAAYGNGLSGVAAAGTTKTTSTMDVIAGFATTIDKIDVSAFGFGAGGLGGGIVDKGTVTSDTAFNTILTTGAGVTGVFGDGGLVQRGLAVIHMTTVSGVAQANDVLLIDVNKDGAFTAGTDIAVRFIGTPALVIGDFVI